MKRSRNKLGFLSVLCLGMIICGTSAYGAVWYVDAGAPPGGDGTSWATAYRDMQSAIDAASPFYMICMAPLDQIWVKAGTYVLTSQIDVDKVVSIYGGFDGSETELGRRDWRNNLTIVDGDHDVRCFNVTALSEINGFTIRNGAASTGAGIYINSTPRYCATFDFYHTPRIKNCTIENNTAADGGGILIRNSCPTIEKCKFIGNQATDLGGGGGGAIYEIRALSIPSSCFTDITNSLFYQNTTNDQGGAISIHQSNSFIRYCTFSENQAPTGGALYTVGCEPYINSCIFWGDTPDEVDVGFGTEVPYIYDSTIQGGYTGPGAGNIDEDPLFVAAGDLHLSLGSPCIDAGGFWMPYDDLDGVPRPHDGDGDGDPVSDMGAYELAPPVIDDISYDACISQLCTAAIQVSTHDPAGGTLTYAWSAPSGGHIIGTGASVSFDPPAPAPRACSYDVAVSVSSSTSGLSTENTLHIIVKLAGDANGDGVVDRHDRTLVRSHYRQTPFHRDWDPRADLNCDGVVTRSDLRIVRNQDGETGCRCE